MNNSVIWSVFKMVLIFGHKVVPEYCIGDAVFVNRGTCFVVGPYTVQKWAWNRYIWTYTLGDGSRVLYEKAFKDSLFPAATATRGASEEREAEKE
jgi:hypothetical protein